MKRLILCTAGHVDHGKTALVRTLTGIECDTHPEEKRRGITINPGFAYVDLPMQEQAVTIRLGIVDVPGHHRFIRNMLAGACSVDLALLVVACDDGVMPQTREHLSLLELLGVREGLVALTKADLATPDLLALVREDVQSALAGSFLEQAELVPFSSLTGAGLPELRAAIVRVVARTAERSTDGMFRMYADRVFSVAGFGTVVTGSIMGGQVAQGDTLLLLPGGIETKVRRIERHGEVVAVAQAGERASLNLGGVARDQLVRGTLLADRSLPATSRIDVRLTVVGVQTELETHTHAVFFAGTHETPCRVHLLGSHRAQAGENTLAQIELERPTVLLPGDRYILRSAGADLTLGGGSCIDVAPLHHRRPSQTLVEQVHRRASGNLAGAIVAETEKHISAIGVGDIAAALGIDRARVNETARTLAPTTGILVLGQGDDLHLMGKAAHERTRKAVHEVVTQYHHNEPLSTRGVTVQQVTNRLAIGASWPVAAFLEGLVVEGMLRRTDQGGYALAAHKADKVQALAGVARHILGRLVEAGVNLPVVSELEQEVIAKFHVTAKECKAVLKHLVEEGKLVVADDAYLVREAFLHWRLQLLAYLAEHTAGITVAQYRDLIDGNRKVCLMMLALCDREGVTLRQGDVRVLTAKGRAALGE